MIKVSWVKVSRFALLIRYIGKSFTVLPITTFVDSIFQLNKTVTHFSTKVSCSSCELSWELSLADSEMDDRLLTHECADFTLSRMTIHRRRKRRATVEFETKIEWIISRFLISLFCKLASLISWLKPSISTSIFTAAVEYFKIFHGVSFQWNKTLAKKTFAFYLNRESFLTTKLLSFTVCYSYNNTCFALMRTIII